MLPWSSRHAAPTHGARACPAPSPAAVTARRCCPPASPLADRISSGNACSTSTTAVAAVKGFGVPALGGPKGASKGCPCGSGNDYSACCQKLHKLQQLKAAGPEQLLRARFAAYVKGDVKYVMRTTHSANPARQGSTSADGELKASFERDIQVTMKWADMSALKIHRVRPGPTPTQKEVDFQYNMRQRFELQTGQPIKDPPSKVISETAVFEMEDGEWKLLGSQNNWDREKLVVTS